MQKLTIYKGLGIVSFKELYFVEYGAGNNREIKNNIQVEFIKHYFKQYGVNKKAVLNALNDFSKKYNMVIETKKHLDRKKFYNMLDFYNTGYYGVGAIKEGRKKIGDWYLLDYSNKNQELLKALQVFDNVQITQKIKHQFAPELNPITIIINK